MKARPTLRSLGIALAVAGGVGLSVGAIHLARAGDSAATPRSPSLSLAGVPDGHEGPVCRVGEKPKWHVSPSDALSQVLQKARAEAAGEKVVVLNTRGYNYRNSRDIWRELEIVQREARQQGR